MEQKRWSFLGAACACVKAPSSGASDTQRVLPLKTAEERIHLMWWAKS